MAGPEILREIVVKISQMTEKKIKGTGFFVSENEIATCYHVLAEGKSPLSECYFVKNDAWQDWDRGQALNRKMRQTSGCCSSPNALYL